MGPFAVGAFPILLPDSFLVVGISVAQRGAVDVSSLFLCGVVRDPAVSAVHTALPGRHERLRGIRRLFYSRKGWIFGFLALLFLVDVGDTLIKGLPYFRALGPVYYFRTVSLLVLSLVAIKVDDRRFQAAFAVFALLCEFAFIVTAHLTVG